MAEQYSMTVKRLLLISCATVANCQSTISNSNDATHERGLFEDMRSEMESIHHMLIDLQQSAVRSETQLKSEIEDLRQVVAQQKYWSRNECPPGFDYLQDAGSCYKVISERMTWNKATEMCRQVMPGVHLAAITSEQENNAVVGYLQSHFSGGNSKCMHDVNNDGTPWPDAGNLIWISGQTRHPQRCGDPYVWRPLKGIEIPFNYANWYSIYPDCHQGVENCVQIMTGRNYTWNDYDCTWSACAICELHV